MLSVGWLVVTVLVAVLLTVWITFTLTRLDRLHARVDAAWAALDAQLVRRAAAVLGAAEAAGSGLSRADRTRCETVAHAALNEVGATDTTARSEAGLRRQEAENGVGRALADLVAVPDLRAEARDELQESANRVLIARRFYNDAVRDTRTLRARRMPRLLRLAGRRAMPQFFDIDDTVPNVPPQPAVHPGAPVGPATPAPEQAEEVP